MSDSPNVVGESSHLRPNRRRQNVARAEEIIGLGGETFAKSSGTPITAPITADCAPRRSFHRTLDRILRNAGFKGNDDGPRTV
jgi:hypothetical protein